MWLFPSATFAGRNIPLKLFVQSQTMKSVYTF
jgi:hypothetical protein